MSTTQTGTISGARCLICDAHNSQDAFLCSQCSAPMAIVHDSVAQNRSPRIVSVIGESNVGKTVYLGFLLDMLAQRARDFKAIPKGAYSIDLQQTVISHLSQRCFPPKTPMEANQWYWAYYQICKYGAQHNDKSACRWIDLVMPDMAGESLAAEITTPKTFKVIHSLLTHSAGMLLLIDSAQAANGATQPDFFALKMLSYIDTMFAGSRNQRIQTPTAVVLCKADYCPEVFDNPRQFVEANLNRLWNMCETRFENVEFFASSVVGSLGYATDGEDSECVVPVPLHTALQGILEPFEWVIDQF